MFAVHNQALEKALDAVEQRQYQVIEALARAPRHELGDEDDDDDGSDASSSREPGEGGAQPDAEMLVESPPASAAVATGSVIQRLMRALEGASQAPRGAAAAQRDAPGAGGGLPVGGDGEEGVGTALSAFLEHLITKNSGATRNIQPVGLSGAVRCPWPLAVGRCTRQRTGRQLSVRSPVDYSIPACAADQKY